MLHIAVTEAAREDEAAALDDAHGHARNLVTRHETANERREIVGDYRFASRVQAADQEQHDHDQPHATVRSRCSSGIRKRQTVRRIITLEKKTSPMNRPRL